MIHAETKKISVLFYSYLNIYIFSLGMSMGFIMNLPYAVRWGPTIIETL